MLDGAARPRRRPAAGGRRSGRCSSSARSVRAAPPPPVPHRETASARYGPRPGSAPPANPPANIVASSPDPEQATDQARADQGLGPADLRPGCFRHPVCARSRSSWSRTSSGPPGGGPLRGDDGPALSLTGRPRRPPTRRSDPSFPQSLTGVGDQCWPGRDLGRWLVERLAANYEWMYQDGVGGSSLSTLNINCTSPRPAAAGVTAMSSWPARGLHPAGHCAHLGDGGGANPTAFFNGSLAAIFVCTDAPPTDEVFTPTQARSCSASPRCRRHGGRPGGTGYWEASSTGVIRAFGSAAHSATCRGRRSTRRSSAWRRPPDGGGYWLVAADGGLFSFGDARFYGSTGVDPPHGRPSSAWRSPPTAAATGSWPPTAGFRLRRRRFTGRWAPAPRPPDGRRWRPILRHRRLLAGGRRRGRLQLRDAPFYGSTGGLGPQPPDRGHGGRHRRGPATGSSPPTVVSSPSTAPSRGRWGAAPWPSR